LAVEEATADADDVVALLADRAGQRALAALDADVRADPTRFLELAPVSSWLKVTLEQLREPASRVDASDRLVAWLVQRGEGEV
jgi:hypothetical protein